MTQTDPLEMRKIIPNLMVCSTESIRDDDKHNVMDSIEFLQKGMVKLAQCSPPLDTLLLLDD
jgi:hypothetical protein